MCETGKGFPDLSLLEPLADALGLTVTELLHGERGFDEPAELTVRGAIGALCAQTRSRLRHLTAQVIASAALALLSLWIMWAAVANSGIFLRNVDITVTAGIYAGGELTGECAVKIVGRQNPFTGRFTGRFAISAAELTCRSGAAARVEFSEEEGQSLDYALNGDFNADTGVERKLYISRDLQNFGLRIDGERIVATSESYAQLLSLDYYYPTLMQ